MSESQEHNTSNDPGGDIWVIVEVDEDGVRDCSYEALQEGSALAVGLGRRLTACLLGSEGQTGVFNEQLHGRSIAITYCIEHPLLEAYTTDSWTIALSRMAQEHHPAAILLSATPNGLDLAPRLAARLFTPAVNGCVIVRSNPQGEIECIIPTHQSKVYTTYTSAVSAQPLIATLQPGAIGVESASGQDLPAVTVITPVMDNIEPRVQVIENIPGDPRSIDLRQSERIIAGGRGISDTAGWDLILDAADALAASPAGSRKALDMGLLPRDRLVGLSGKSAAPKFYFAAGISGDHYHLRAVNTDHLIAINSDRKAPILTQAKLGVVGDLRDILPLLAAKLRARQQGGE